MKVIYQAENAIDANLLKGLLEQDGIMAFVSGEYLQGGVGELPMGGLITVSVTETELEAAMRIVADFQKINTAPVEDETRWDPSDQLFDYKG